LTKLKTGEDIRNQGTGNMGAANTLDVTGDKSLAFFVFLLDALKGSFAVIMINQFFGVDAYKISLGVIFVVLGHNLNIFMKGKGGRGLATAFGAIIVINPLPAILWCLVWAISSKLFKKNVHFANIISSILSPIMLFNTPALIIKNMTIIKLDNLFTFIVMFIMVNVLILIKHKEYFKDFIDEFKG